MEHAPPPVPPPAEPVAASVAELERKVIALERQANAAARQAEEYLNGWKRAKADYQNLKREHEQQSWELAKSSVESVIGNLWVDYYGNLLPAFGHISPEHAELPWVKGLQNGIKQFEAVLKKLGFVSFTPAVGDPFDPARHEAVASIAVPGQTSGTIAAVVRPGLLQGDTHAAMVTAAVQVVK